ncbi:MAG: efflux RND transporter periplasmic adaptor subunit [Proteobacteria bacterium]|nr:efflux RND transporter periplasmic adaptor subunit [Pseudomonadota bacterium]
MNDAGLDALNPLSRPLFKAMQPLARRLHHKTRIHELKGFRKMIRDTSAQDVVIDSGPARRRKLKTAAIAAGAVALLLVIALPAYNRWASAEISVPLERLRIANIERTDFVRDVGVTGRIVAAVAPTLYSTAIGTVTLEVKAGDTVEQGQVLATVDSPEVVNELAREQANLESIIGAWERQKIDSRSAELQNQQSVDLAKVRLDAARREAERAQLSYDEGVMSRQEMEKSYDELATAEVEYKHAVENAELAKDSLVFELRSRQLEVDRQKLLVANLQRRADELTIRSPVSGMVGNVAVAQRSAVAANTPVLTVVDLTALEVETQIPESYADSLGLGMPAEINYGASSYPGVVTAVSPEVQNAQVTTRVRFEGDAPQDLRQNQRVSVRIVMETKDDVLTVQRGPFLESGSGRMAYVVRDGLAVRTPIRVGSASVNRVEIVDGLQEGDRIVISSTDSFENAETVYLTD